MLVCRVGSCACAQARAMLLLCRGAEPCSSCAGVLSLLLLCRRAESCTDLLVGPSCLQHRQCTYHALIDLLYADLSRPVIPHLAWSCADLLRSESELTVVTDEDPMLPDVCLNLSLHSDILLHSLLGQGGHGR